jgi:hypothetical protein
MEIKTKQNNKEAKNKMRGGRRGRRRRTLI